MQTKPKANSVVTASFDATINTITWNVLGEGGGTTTLHLDNMSEGNKARAIVHGMSARVGDAAAKSRDPVTGKPMPPATKLAALVRLTEHYNSGAADWSPAREGGTGPGLDPVILAAVVEVLGKETAEVRAMILAQAEAKGVTPKVYLATLGEAKHVKPVVAWIRAKELPKGLDGDELLERMMAGEPEGNVAE